MLNPISFACIFTLLAQSSFASTDSKPPFLWGVANAAFQVEGSPEDSDIYRNTHTKGWVKDGTNADVATDFWNRYDEDFALAQELGVNAFRISIAWERVEPKRGQWNDEALAHYEKIILAMRARGIEPVITLLHNVLPVWASEAGGVFSSQFTTDFADYSEHVVKRLSQGPAHVTYWLTLNEPTTYAEGSYTAKGGSSSKYLKAIKNQALAHIAAYKKIHALSNGAELKVSYAQDWLDFETPAHKKLMDPIARKLADRFYNRPLLDKVMKAMPGHKPALDFLGINYYNREIAHFTLKGFVKTEPGPGPKNDMNTEIYAPGFEKVLVAASSYGLPILVTENGVTDHTDAFRPQFIEDHIHYLLKAIHDDHVNVIGYMHWSLTDNFEWSWGLTPRYGLVEMDYKTLKRTKREASFSTYQRLIKENKNP